MTNHLAGEASSYLRSAAHQPVAWSPWGEQAFARAKAENKPILLDIGAVWCHWCHVMDRESYEDPALAELINRLFVPVKVDRDERPDVDARYQKAIQAMTGQGGWPLTAFLIPDGRVFYGGTYFPPRDAHGRPSFRRVLESVADAYGRRKEEILANADQLTAHLAKRGRHEGKVEEAQWEELLEHAVGHVREEFDAKHGGFGAAPKFPHPAAVDFLLARSAADASAKDMALATLRAMREGGIYDQLAGGFHRYSVDARWHVPHFEKMLYDNAGLLRNYARAARVSDDPLLRQTASEIVGFLQGTLGQPAGGFGGSQDADMTLEDDGDHFTWTLEELKDAIPEHNLQRLMAAHFDVREQGDMHHDPRRCVLRLSADAPALAEAFHLDLPWVESELARGKGLMRDARAKRPVPFVDPMRYTSWNAMAIAALLEHGGVASDGDADAIALRALDLFLAEAFTPERGWRRGLGQAAAGLLDDNAQMLDALLEAHYATGDARILVAARQTADLLLSDFPHPDGGFADRAPRLAGETAGLPLAAAERPIQDAPTASGNGVALRALLRLGEATGEARYREAALESLRKLGHEAAHLSLFGGALLLALHDAVRPPPRIVLAQGNAAAYRAAARRAAPPGATFAAPDDPGVPEEARAFRGEGALVCLGMRCLAPATSPAMLEARLREVAAEAFSTP
jgi:hypothetical protein